jgi:hypothetical protein
MISKTVTKEVYVCEYCGLEHNHISNAEKCEERCKAMKEATTQWTKDMIKTMGMDDYNEALRLLSLTGNKVVIFPTNEIGSMVWVIAPDSTNLNNTDDINFWLWACETKKAALKLCKEMGWEVVG